MTRGKLETTITRKGQITIPLEIRSRLGLKPKDRVRFELEGEVIKLRPAPSRVLRWYGSVAPAQRPADLRELREEFERGVAAEVVAEG